MGDRYAVKANVKELVHFDFHNLKTEYLPDRNDIIFCRNVTNYFDEAEQTLPGKHITARTPAQPYWTMTPGPGRRWRPRDTG